MPNHHVTAAALALLVAALGACDGDQSMKAGSAQEAGAPTPGGAKTATYSPAEICFSNEAFDELTKSFPEQPEEAADAADAAAPPTPDAGAESAKAAAAGSEKEAAAAAVPAADSAAAATAADGADSADETGFAALKILKRRKDYCCHSPTGGQKAIRASHTASAILKCKKHAPLGWVSKGSC